MRALISRSKIHGRADAPSSKSYTLRGLMCAALAGGQSEIIRPLESDDTQVAFEVLTRIGVNIHAKDNRWLITGGNFHQPGSDLYCRDSAGTLRFMTAICSLVPGTCRLTAGPTLSKRTVNELEDALKQLGVRCSSHNGLAPVTVEGGSFRGGTAELPGDVSSQFVSALLFIAPFASEGTSIRLTSRVESKPYILMTLDCMQHFGIRVEHTPDLRSFTVKHQAYRPANYMVEGDWSSASYLLALGATAGSIEIGNLNNDSRQADRTIFSLMKQMGTGIKAGHSSIQVAGSALKAVTADLSNCIDLLPTMAVLAAVADGVSEFTGIDRAKLKESDRVAAVIEGLSRMGITIRQEADRLVVQGSAPRGAVIDSKDDHRIAMAFSILGVLAGNTVIEGAECVTKTYPDYWDVLKSLGGEVILDGK